MANVIFEIVLIIILIILTGILSMAELAVVSTKKAKLEKLLNEGHKSAQIIIDFAEDPNQFLSTVQIGITLIGILTGAYGGATLAEPLSQLIGPYIPYSGTISILVVVIVTIGEIVPKVIALNNPEKVSLKLAKSMAILSKVCRPISVVLAKSTDFVLWTVGMKSTSESIVTEEEIELLIEEGREDGTIEKEEEDIIKRVFKLDDKKVESIMTPRNEIIWVNLEDDKRVNEIKIMESKRSIFPIASGELDDFIGVVQAKDILALLFSEEKFDINSIIKKPLVVSENLETLELLKEFKENKEYVHMALAVDEFGSVEGLITLNDLLEGIVGDIPGIDETDDPMATQRIDGTWLIDGRFQIDKFKELFDYEKEFPDEKEDQYTTIAGFILSLSGKIPNENEVYEWDRFRFEIIDIDGHQIDKILVTDLGPQEEETAEDVEND